MKTTALIERGKDGLFGIYTPEINHTIIGEGESVAEAKDDFENSVKEIYASYTEQERLIPKELKKLEFVYKYDLASFFDYYSFINVSKFAKIVKINPSLMRQYKTGQYISEAQMAKIESAIHSIGNELASVQLF